MKNTDKTIQMHHGSGGLHSQKLIREVFLHYLNNKVLEPLGDSGLLPDMELAMTTDSYVVDPPVFPGGDIGKLAVCGTVNDLAVTGAKPLYLSAGFILEEGLPLEILDRIVSSMAAEAKAAGVSVITGDTKVVPKGKADKIFINTAGIGLIGKEVMHVAAGREIHPGDKVLVNGYLGDHAIAVLSAREELPLTAPVLSDCASLHYLILELLQQPEKVRFIRDLTRGGLGTVLNEMAAKRNWGIEIEEARMPVREEVGGICEMLGFDPLYLANEGKIVLVVEEEYADKCLGIMRKYRCGKESCCLGEITGKQEGRVLMKTRIGGRRIIDTPAGDQLPRIC